jgi:hypothetical protein
MTTTTQIQPTTLISRAREVTFDQVDQEYYAVDSKAGYFYNMSETGNRIWELLATPQSVNALCAQLQQEYRIDAATCLQQVVQVLTKLRDAGLIQTNDVATA